MKEYLDMGDAPSCHTCGAFMYATEAVTDDELRLYQELQLIEVAKPLGQVL